MRAPPRSRTPPRALALLLALCAACGAASGARTPRPPAAPASQRPAAPFAFAVLSGVLRSAHDEGSALRLLDAIGLDRAVEFTVYDGNLKGPDETCIDQLYDQRRTVLDAARGALVLVPGQFDWASCASAGDGGYDPVERLDFLRQEIMSDSHSLGQTPLALTRESEVPRFRPFRENTRWAVGNTVFIGLNAPGPNNRYLTAGGRNGEFDDRAIANAFWVEHATEYAKRLDARAIVIFMEGDPQFERDARGEHFAWLRFDRPRERDGYRELRRALARAAANFRGPLLLIHPSEAALPAGFRIDRPLRDEKGAPVENLTRLEIGPPDRLAQWVRVGVDTSRQPMFRVSLNEVPKRLPKPALPPLAPNDAPQVPDMPQISSPPSLPETGASGGTGSLPASGNAGAAGMPAHTPETTMPPLLPGGIVKPSSGAAPAFAPAPHGAPSMQNTP